MGNQEYGNMTKGKRAEFGTKLGVLATTVGSAVGLGNIWRFPYEVGTHGGGAFLLCYFVFVFLIGVPLMCSEFAMGRGTRSNIFGAYRKLAPGGHWQIAGYLAIIAAVLILSFYSVVAGWTVEYFFQSVSGSLNLDSQQAYHNKFDEFSTGSFRPIFWTIAFLAANVVILLRGVSNGIEKMSNLLMPILFLILIAFCVNSLFLPGAAEGIKFLFMPDFSKITGTVLLGALGQAFFSLSLGMGCMMTYSSYFKDDTNLVRSSFTIAALDSLVAIMAGIIIFPAVFSFGGEPAAGPTLVFEVLPTIFHRMPFGAVWSSLFFFLLFLASLTSTISVSEIVIAFLIEEKKMSRRKATWFMMSVVILFGALCSLSFGPFKGFTIAGLTVFNLFDFVSSNILLPLGGFILAIFTGWKLNSGYMRDQLTNNGRLRGREFGFIMTCVKFICPAAILLVFLNCIGIL